jgi:uncharacterized membrane protein YjgN (DUF898 family)
MDEKKPFSFTGSGSEYFRIWIVNLTLTILTFGIYSAWAKVRRLQYFYRNTWVNEANFDYHGDPTAILKGRVLAVILLSVYNLSSGLSPIVGLLFLIPLLVVLPVLLYKSLRFRAINSSYRGLRFGFSAKLSEAYKTFLLWPFLALATMFVLVPAAHQRLRRFQHGSARFGASHFGFHAGIGGFYALYGKTFLLILGLPILWALMFGGGFATISEPMELMADTEESGAAMLGLLMMAIFLTFILGALLIGPYFTSRLQNLVWKETTLDAHRFGSDLTARGLFWIKLTNLLGIVLTFGLFKPFADIRLLRYRIEHMWLESAGDLDGFVRDAEEYVAAFGEEAAEMFDVDIGL